MKPDTRDWVDLAEADFALAVAALQKRKRFTTNLASYHLQQCAEKYFKARIVEDGLPIIRTHDPQTLLNHILPSQPLWASFNSSLGILTSYGVNARYPGFLVTRADVRIALKICRSIRAEIRLSLGLPKK